MKKFPKLNSLCLVLFALSGCGEDAYKGSTPAPVDPGTGVTSGGVQTTVATVTSLYLSVNPDSIGTGANTKVLISARAKDSNNNVVAGATVSFRADGGDLFVTQGVTDSLGFATAELTAQSDPRVRSITITATTTSGATSTTSISVTGTTLSVSGATNLVFGNPTTLTIQLSDSNGKGLGSKPLNISTNGANALAQVGNSTNSGTSITVDTDSDGQAQVVFTGQTNPGTVTVSALNGTVLTSYVINVSQDTVSFVTNEPPTGDLQINQIYPVSVNWIQSGVGVNPGTINFSATRGTVYGDNAATIPVTSAATDVNGTARIWIRSTNAGPTLIKAEPVSGPEISVEKEFVAPVPAEGFSYLDLQANKSTIGPNKETATLTAIVRDGNNNLVKNVTVEFSIQSDVSGGRLTSPVAKTDSLGRATTTYESSAATTAKDGVIIQARINETGYSCSLPSVDTDCRQIPLTVARAELFVRMGTSNLMFDLDTTRYKKEFNILVTDSGGNAIENKSLTVTFIPTIYYKGYRQWDPVGKIWITVYTKSCINEDLDLDGVLTGSEDQNNNDVLDPGNVAAVPGTITTDVTGFALYDIIFAKNYASWVSGQMTASTQVAGTESSDTMNFTLPILLSALKTEGTVPGLVSPWGISKSCADSGILIPYNVIATPGSDGSAAITLDWESADNACGYTIYWGESFFESVSVPTPGGTLPNVTTSTTYTQEGLTVNQPYFYRVAALFPNPANANACTLLGNPSELIATATAPSAAP